MDIFEKCAGFTAAEEARQAGLYPYFHQIATKQHSEVIMDGHRTIMLGSNNYLGLTSDERVIEAAREGLRKFGAGCSGSRFLNGTLTLHVQLEEELADFFGKEDVVTFSTGFQANLGIISALCGMHDLIFMDRRDHASIFDAARLSFARQVKYDHNDMDDLKSKLAAADPRKGKLIVVDGVFSMEGDLADLPAIVKLAKQYGARVMVDDSHGVGTMGEHGRGVAEYFGLEKEVDVLMGTFSKSFASLGGFMATTHQVAEYVRHVSRPFIFSASMPPGNVAAALEALHILKAEPERVKRVNDNAAYMRRGFESLGIRAGESMAPIIPIVIGTNEATFKVTRDLLEAGVYVNPVVSPAVEEGGSLLRTSYMATHTRDQLDFALEAFGRVLG
ncbi:aminotransferase class I/II-fold pyridoxal phosphate-dependent enzyme [Gehongia tenuis]|uniref:Pyridoxal phosphate-dependent aminotransferase family protein n=1 Tax=Gehongia tenuis TaxID=2763655 RepID=A0A926HPN6_9FIRM|nr:pyridoxal phosphate-dependent aminotransferase family protein [Gehongia tenuis]MBC8530376.1 pyridoxal phosphate-dependent aminotransferase family protein [Gehongia tenuis]